MASQTTCNSAVYSNSSFRLAQKKSKCCVTALCGNHRWPMDSHHKGPLMRNCFHVVMSSWPHGPLTRYVKLQVTHAPGMPGKFSPAAVFKGNRSIVSDPGIHHGTCVTHVPWCMSRSLTCDKPLPEPMMVSLPTHIYASLGLNELNSGAYLLIHVITSMAV